MYGEAVDRYAHYEDDMNIHEETGNDLPLASVDYGNEEGSDHSSPPPRKSMN